MPRFGINSLLVLFVGVAIWLSTLAAYPGSFDVRSAVLALLLLGAAFSAVYQQRKPRAFWAGFFFALLITQTNPRVITGPAFRSISERATNLAMGLSADAPALQRHMATNLSYDRYEACYQTIKGTLEIAFACAGGVVGSYVYERSRNSNRYGGGIPTAGS